MGGLFALATTDMKVARSKKILDDIDRNFIAEQGDSFNGKLGKNIYFCRGENSGNY
jgi:hypothetical protein